MAIALAAPTANVLSSCHGTDYEIRVLQVSDRMGKCVTGIAVGDENKIV